MIDRHFLMMSLNTFVVILLVILVLVLGAGLKDVGFWSWISTWLPWSRYQLLAITVRVPLSDRDYNTALAAFVKRKWSVTLRVPKTMVISNALIEDIYDDLNKRILGGR